MANVTSENKYFKAFYVTLTTNLLRFLELYNTEENTTTYQQNG